MLCTVKTGEEVRFNMGMLNQAGFVKSIDYTFTQDGESVERHLDLESPLTRLLQVGQFEVQAATPEVAAMQPVSLSVDKVNGTDNAETVLNETEGAIIAVDKVGQRRSVYEAFTTISSPQEVLAMASLPLLRNAVGDKMIAINAHFTADDENPDPMNCEDYSDLAFSLTNGTLPAYYIDRLQQFNPYFGTTPMDGNGTYHFNADKTFNDVNSRACEVDFELTAQWADDSKTQLEATTQTTFYLNSEEPFYAIGFVLTEDDVCYEEVKQQNALSPDYFDDWNWSYPENNKLFPDDDLREYTTGPAEISAPVNQNVVRGAWEPVAGIDGSVEAIESDKAQQFTTVLDIADKTVLDKNNLKLVALLINLYDGSIVNAAEVSLSDETTAVASLGANDSQKVSSRYSVSGQLLKAPHKGLNIVKLANGKTLKMIVR